MTDRPTEDTLLAAVREPLSASGLDVEDVQLSTAGRRRVVRILVDRDGGVTLDEIAEATRVVGAALDDDETMGDHPYTLEVTSPGIDRPLTAPRHWRRNADRLVAVTLTDGTTITGRIVASDAATATLDVDGTRRELPYEDVASARIEVEFNRRPREQE